MPPENLCRLCGVICQPLNFVQVFQNENKSQLSNVGEMMLDCLFSELECNTGYPEIVCQYCYLQLNGFYEFKKKVLEQHDKFTQLIQIKVSNEQEKKYQKNNKIIKNQSKLDDSTCTNNEIDDDFDEDNSDNINKIQIVTINNTNYLINEGKIDRTGANSSKQKPIEITIVENKCITNKTTIKGNDDDDVDNHADDDDDNDDVDDEQSISDSQEISIDCCNNEKTVESSIDKFEYSETEYLDEENYNELNENFVNNDNNINSVVDEQISKSVDEIMIAEYIDDPDIVDDDDDDDDENDDDDGDDDDDYYDGDDDDDHNKKINDKLLKNTIVKIGKVKLPRRYNKTSHQQNQLTIKKKYQCGICARYFSTQATCNSHEYRHSNVRPFPCDICFKKFKLRCDLRVHMLCHNDIRNYSCNICGKAFRMHSHLADHKQTHVTENKIECDECGLKFKTSVTLKSHKKQIHSADHPHKCSYCNRGFYRKNKLTRHELSHTKQRKSRTQVQLKELPLPPLDNC